jgi:hypothetical protein
MKRLFVLYYLRTHACILFVIFINSISYAQQSVHSGGGNVNGTGGSSSFSIGQTFFSAQSGSSGSASQGVQHAYIIIPSGVKKITSDITISVFPNPTSDIIEVESVNQPNTSLFYHLLDLQGKELWNNQLISNKTKIDMANLAAGNYFVIISDSQNKQLHSFKVLKK